MGTFKELASRHFCWTYFLVEWCINCLFNNTIINTIINVIDSVLQNIVGMFNFDILRCNYFLVVPIFWTCLRIQDFLSRNTTTTHAILLISIVSILFCQQQGVCKTLCLYVWSTHTRDEYKRMWILTTNRMCRDESVSQVKRRLVSSQKSHFQSVFFAFDVPSASFSLVFRRITCSSTAYQDYDNIIVYGV